ncbi:MAG TPA: Rrf2 family transcriptional regulator [Duganella sp.]|nr:Rrf2 family transcriptional regulator [Duganella sp.]
MSHISTAVEYGLHCLLLLATAEDAAPETSARDLAELQGVSPDYVAKLFTKLGKAGLVRATEGARGGYTLAKPLDQISVLAVVEAIDGRKDLFACREIRARCAVFEGEPPRWATQGVCSIHAVMLAAEQSMREVLARHTLADLSRRVDAKAPAGFSSSVVNWLERRR